MQSGIFISHSSKDRKAAVTICQAVEARGHRCWLSSRDVHPGQNYQEAIVDAVRAAPMMILVFSTNANNSGEIKKELALASQAGLTVIPVRIEDVIPSGAFTYELATRQWIDVFGNWEQDMAQLLSQIEESLPTGDDAAPPHAPVSPSPRPMPPPSAAPASPRKITPARLAVGALVLVLLVGLSQYFRNHPLFTPTPAADSNTVTATLAAQEANAARSDAPSNAAPSSAAQASADAAMKTASDALDEAVLWNSIRDSGDAAALRSYLARYPKGIHVTLARTRLAGLAAGKGTASATNNEIAPPGGNAPVNHQPAGVPMDLTGDWCSTAPEGANRPARIEQDALSFQFHTTNKAASTGRILSSTQIVADGWNLHAAVMEGGARLVWQDGAIWHKGACP